MGTIQKTELDALRYVIFIVGRGIGIDDDLNLCNGTLSETKAYSHLILTQIIKPSLKIESNLSKEMSDNLLQGSEMLNPYLIPESFKTWTFRLFGVSYEGNTKCLSFMLLEIIFNNFLHGQMGYFMRPILSSLMKVNIFLANKWEKHIMVKERRPIL